MAENDVEEEEEVTLQQQQQQQPEERRLAPLPPPLRRQQEDPSSSSSSSSQRRRPRLVIEKMVLENFKSYAGVQEIGPFHRCFTAVVGPNGSGKSNVLDALLFVFGKRAKQIRQRKVGELVHRSASHPDIAQASVTVHFREVVDTDDAGDAASVAVAGSELQLKRTATRSHQSKYYVNGRPASFGEVTALLRAKGVDLANNRFLILQGEVEQVAAMPPKAAAPGDAGMLEYLEEIIGTDRYVPLIAERVAELERVQETRTEKLNRARLAERERAALEAAKREAEDFLGKDLAIVRKRAAIAQAQRRACERDGEALSARRAELGTRLRELRERAAEAATRLAAAEQAAKRATAEMERLTARSAKAKADFAAFQRHDVQLREDAKHLRAQEKRLRKAIAAEEEKAASAASDAARCERERAEEVARAERLKRELEGEEATLDEVYKSLRGVTGPLQERMEAMQRQLLPAQTKRTDAESQRTVLASELAMLQGAEGEKAKRIEELRAAAASMREAEEQISAELERVAASLRDRKQRLVHSKEKAQALAAEEQRHAAGVRNLRARVEEAKALAAASRSRGAVYQTIMGLKSSKQVAGIFGRLGDLGVINAKYDVAVTTACGALDNIVVQTTAAAQQCVEHLRRGGVGRATFAILDEISKNDQLRANMAAPFSEIQESRRLFDLIKVKDERYRPAFYWALADTLVVKDLETASRVAFGGAKRRRVVTLQGELIEPQGTMSGGGKSVARGGMRTTTGDSVGPTSSGSGSGGGEDDASSLQELEAQLAAASAELEKARSAKAAADIEVASLESLSETTTAKLQMDVQAKRQRREEAEKAVAVAEEKPALTPAQLRRMDELGDLIAKCERTIAELREMTVANEGEIEEIKEKIMAAGGTRLREQKERVAALTDELAKAERSATKCGVDVGTLGKAAKKSKAAAEKAQAELDATVAKLDSVRAEQKGLEDKALEVMNAHEDARKAAEAKAEDAQQQQQQLDALRSETNKTSGEEAGIVDELEECSKNLSERQRAAKSYTKQLAELQGTWNGIQEMLRGGEPLQVQQQQEAAAAAAADPDKMDTSDDGAQAPSKSQDDPFRDIPEEELAALDLEELRVDISALEEEKTKLSPNMGAIAEYYKKAREHAERLKELEEVTAVRDRLRSEVELLRKRRLDEFMEGFEQITLKLKEMYRMITIGGDAELELVDRLNPFSEGVVFSVRPAKKSWKLISNLSGGEKTLSSLALVFALHHYKPTPIYVMDEIDAALDFRNVSIVANYIKERTRGAQFVVVSLRNYMFELADQLVGIFKIADCTGSIAIAPSEYVSALPIPAPAAQ